MDLKGDESNSDSISCLIVSLGPSAHDIRAAIQRHVSSYIWEHQALVIHSDVPCPWDAGHLTRQNGTLFWANVQHCGSLDDEWFVVFLMSYLTDVFKGSILVQVWSSDGQFMLADAAHLLPAWLDSSRHGSLDDIARNRVWLHEGMLHIIPIQSSSNTDLSPASLTLDLAVSTIVSSATPTQAPARIQEHLKTHQLAKFPAALNSLQHYSTARLPRAAATVLLRSPAHCAAAARAFLERSPEDMQAGLRNASCWPSAVESGPGEVVPCTLLFRRSHYACLAAVSCAAPKNWPMPAVGTALRKQAELGLKLTLGLNICAHHAQRVLHFAQEAPDAGACEMEDLPEGRRYIDTLQKQGFFGGAVEGSAAYKRALKQAEHAFRESISFNSLKTQSSVLLGDLESAQTDPLSNEELSKRSRADDSEKWMLDEFNQRLERYDAAEHAHHQCPGQDDNPATGVSSDNLDAQDVIDRLSQFFQASSQAAGAKPTPSSFSLSGDALLNILKGIDLGSGSTGSSSGESVEDDDVSASPMHSQPDIEIGKSQGQNNVGRDDTEQPDMQAYMQKMDEELATAGRDTCVNVDLESVKNLLKSVTESSNAQPGAAQGLFGMLGVQLKADHET